MSDDRPGNAPLIDPAMDQYAEQFLAGIETMPTYRSTVGCVIPAYNEEEAIADVLDSLLAQTLLPDAIHVIVNNTTDATVEIASHYAGLHTRGAGREEQMTEIFVHDIGENPDKKVGALNYGYTLVEGMDFLLGVDGDTTAEPHAIEYLVQEIQEDDRIGGISAIYSIDDSGIQTTMGKFLIAGQRAQFAAFNMQNLLRGRNMAVLGGQYSIFSTEALRKVVQQTHQRYPWVRDSEIEDALLSLQIKSAGYLTKISARARANVGGMLDMRSLDAQQVKWNTGGIDLMWPGQRGDTRGQPLHPNLRLRWFENFSMVVNGFTRWAFFFLLISSLMLHAFVFVALWLAPTLVATVLNLRIAHSLESATRRDYLFALLWLPAELYMWIRLGHFARSWTKFFSSSQTDNWALQAKAESGSGGLAYLTPIAMVVITLSGAVAIWAQLSKSVQSSILLGGWTFLGIVTVLQTAWLAIKLCRRYKGFKT
jgi:biofilm PGA synthesis N-glycosyltransferase PgaC